VKFCTLCYWLHWACGFLRFYGVLFASFDFEGWVMRTPYLVG
jgi:hypothetical protein